MLSLLFVIFLLNNFLIIRLCDYWPGSALLLHDWYTNVRFGAQINSSLSSLILLLELTENGCVVIGHF